MAYAVAAAVVVAGASAYSAKKQGKAAESAANKQAAGVTDAMAATKEAQERALPLIEQGFVQGREAITAGDALAQQNLLSGRDESLRSLGSGYDQARSDAIGGFDQAGRTLDSSYNQAQQQFQPMAQQGAGASQLQAALSGALGPEAEQKAIANFTESPGQKYLRDQQEQSILRNESALGGGVSANGRVLTALQEQAMGRAATNLDNRFNQAGVVADRGYNSSASIADLKTNLGQSKSAIQQQLGSLLSGMSINRGAGVAGIQGNTATNLANLNTNTAGNIGQSLQNQGTTQGNVLINQGSEMAQLNQNLGQANAGGDIYNAQNVNPWVQGLQAGVGAYGAMGGGYSSLSGNRSMNTGSTQAGYSGPAYNKWAAQQRGVS